MYYLQSIGFGDEPWALLFVRGANRIASEDTLFANEVEFIHSYLTHLNLIAVGEPRIGYKVTGYDRKSVVWVRVIRKEAGP